MRGDLTWTVNIYQEGQSAAQNTRYHNRAIMAGKMSSKPKDAKHIFHLKELSTDTYNQIGRLAEGFEGPRPEFDDRLEKILGELPGSN